MAVYHFKFPFMQKLFLFGSSALAMTCLLIACSSGKYTPQKLPDNRLHFGSGGGFTGAVTEYILLENGQLFLADSYRKDTVELTTMSRAQAKGYFKSLDSLRLEKYDFYHPGNMHFFLRQVDEIIDHKVTWGDQQVNVRDDVKRLHANLQEAVKGRKILYHRLPEKEKKDKNPSGYWQ